MNWLKWRDLRSGLLIAVAAIWIGGCASYTESPKGTWTVIDPTTNPPTPVEGVKLLFAYRGLESAVVESREVCDYAAVRKTDGKGVFEWPEPRLSRWTIVAAYKRGYANPSSYDNVDAKSKTIYLAPSKDHEKLIAQFWHVNAVARCGGTTRTSMLIDQFLGDTIPDLREIASTPSDLQLLDMMERRRELLRP